MKRHIQLADILPEGFDKDLIRGFFGKGSSKKSELLELFSDPPAKEGGAFGAAVAATVKPVSEEKEYVGDVTEEEAAAEEPEFLYYLSSTEDHNHNHSHDHDHDYVGMHICDGQCDEDCTHAQDQDTYSEPEIDVSFEFDDARGGKGGKKSTDDTGGGEKGNGRGKNKVVEEDPPEQDPAPVPEEPVAEDPAPAPEDPVAEEPAPAPEEPVAEDPAPAPEEPEAEDPAPGTSGDFGWIDDNTYISGGDTPDGYNIKLIFKDDWTDAEKLAAANAAETLSDMITGDVEDFNGIDDIVIEAFNQSVDGSGGVVAQGGVVATRGNELNTVSEGAIRVDSADADNLLSSGKLEDVLVHEMLHAMGFGSGWAYNGLREQIDGDWRFTGETATSVYESQYADAAASDANSHLGVPLDNKGSHWNEGVFDGELMTPRLDGSREFSDLTLASLEDMGYDTIYEPPSEEDPMQDDFLFA